MRMEATSAIMNALGRSSGTMMEKMRERLSDDAQERLQNAAAPLSPLAEPTVLPAKSGFSGSTVSMADHFTRAGQPERSKYVESIVGENSTLRQLQNSFNASLASIASTLKGENPLGETAGMRRARHAQAIYEASQVNLDEIKQDIEINAAKARAQSKAEAQVRAEALAESRAAFENKPVLKDRNGEPILDATGEPVEIATGGSAAPWPGTTPAAAGQAPPPEVDISAAELEARNIKINVKAMNVKIDLKI